MTGTHSHSFDDALMLEQVQQWSAINTGSGHLAGLASQADMLAEAFSALPGEVELIDPAPVTAIASDGSEYAKANGRHLVVRVRPGANRRIILTGHMDTVFPKDHPFQSLQWLEDDVLNGPGVADMKGGIAVILHALLAFERTAAA
ncbi:MAG: M20/M25/M40 family metallo-hydrolase, partial [Pseudomonadota bacterium]